ncbi:hypothetical protein [Planctomicrobium piriforme]|uniref:Uncharacterized protein n=1 Tax=Planctomicrobium piriforme TaxID=1576369 RepID=A0A1I3ASR0_9PLAN|nr:hypothetical protein [Planctomicrobium piriforme]SFH52371.1 hypothetical protein SAMN05421753_1018 [Planctomicrobium piriforme]
MESAAAETKEPARLSRVWAALWLAFGLWLLYRAIFVGAGSAYVTDLNGRLLGATHNDYLAGGAVFSWSRTIGIWISAFLTLCVFSFLYRDNAFYKFSEAVFVGTSAAYMMVVGFWTVVIPSLLAKIWPAWVQSWAMPGISIIRDENWWLYLMPLLLGGMLLWRLSPRGAWIARWPLAFIIGSTAGIRLIGFLQADFLSQIHNTIEPVIVVETAQSGLRTFAWGESLQNFLLVVCVLAALSYFFFSIEHTGLFGRVSQMGVWVLMITFGAAFGYTVMGRIALLAIRFEFLFADWLWLIDPSGSRLGT